MDYSGLRQEDNDYSGFRKDRILPCGDDRARVSEMVRSTTTDEDENG